MKITGRSLEVLLYLNSRHRSEFAGAELSKNLGISSGTLYPLLVKLKVAGLLEDRWEAEDAASLGRPRRRFYRITGEGAQAIQSKVRQLDPGYKSDSGGFGELDWGREVNS